MSKTGRPNHRRGSRGTPKPERQIVVRSIRRDPPDLRKLSRAVIAMALRDAEAQAEARDGLTNPPPTPTDPDAESGTEATRSEPADA